MTVELALFGYTTHKKATSLNKSIALLSIYELIASGKPNT